MSTVPDPLTARPFLNVLPRTSTAEVTVQSPLGALLPSPHVALLPRSQLPRTLADLGSDERRRRPLFGKVAGLLQRTLLRSRENLVCLGDETNTSGGTSNVSRASLGRTSRVSLVKETKQVSLEYDPITRRKVLNTYEILREIGRGEHGRVKLARDLVHDELVAIKIVSRKSRRERQSLRMRRASNAPPVAPHDYESKIRREIAIMKRCNHKNIVRLKEVLDDLNLYKIYLVLEYMDRGEIRWKRRTPILHPRPLSDPESGVLPCGASSKSPAADEDNELLSDEYVPNLTFRQSRRIFRDVLLGLEYLHMQGIVHRDIKPANLLVSLDYVVKISDFGVSFALSLSSSDDGVQFSDMELAKTVGTPAFFAPELCQTNFSANASSTSVLTSDMPGTPSSSDMPKVSHKIDIWALGVTLYCLLFGKVPFNADSEFRLFDVIVNLQPAFPPAPDAFHSPQEVTSDEFALAKDLLLKMLEKDSAARIDIPQIKQHPFVLLDLENDVEKLNELFFFNADYVSESDVPPADKMPQDEIDNAVVGVGARIRSSIMKAIKTADNDTLRKLLTKMENSVSTTSSSDDSSHLGSMQNLSSHLYNTNNEHSVILSEAMQESSLRNYSDPYTRNLPLPSHLSHQSHVLSLLSQTYQLGPNMSPVPSSNASFVSRNSLRNNLILQDVIDSPVSSRKGSATAILEAPQIETKRNVGGDLYLKNQSAIDAFKDIQEMDQKRRRLSVFTSLSHGHTSVSSTPTKSSEECDTRETPLPIPADLKKVSETPSKIKVGPISIDKSRRPSSVISLPLTESFASLDSINDDYLSLKYMEFRKQKQLTSPVANSDSVLASNNVTKSINEKFQRFNLGSLMAGSIPAEVNPNGSESIAPHKRGYGSSSRSLSVSCLSSSCSSGSGSDSDSDDEGGNLTLKFTSKVTPKSRPPFLSLSNRAHSHESNLPGLAYGQQNGNGNNYFDVPIVFQDDLLELEDVPVGLMGAPRLGQSDFDATDMTPTASTLTGMPSTATIIAPVNQEPVNQRLSIKVPVQSSPLRREITGNSPGSDLPKDGKLKIASSVSSRAPGYFVNHYKKESAKSPFPLSNHMDADRESEFKRELKENRRPTAPRANSVTLSLLQRDLPSNED